MEPSTQFALLATVLIITVTAPHFNALPQSTAENSIQKDRISRELKIFNKGGNDINDTPKWGFFGTIFRLMLEHINDTKSAYNQISDLVLGQFSDGNPTTTLAPGNNGSTTPPKISRQEFLNILDRNLKGLNRLRNIEWREAKKDSAKNLQSYRDEIFGRKKT